MPSFAEQLAEFSDGTIRKVEIAIARSFEDVMDMAQRPVGKGGRMPIDTGALQRSSYVTLAGRRVVEGQEFHAGKLSAYRVGAKMSAGWDAYYAGYVEFGAQGRRPYYFASTAVAAWPATLEHNLRMVANVA